MYSYQTSVQLLVRVVEAETTRDQGFITRMTCSGSKVLQERIPFRSPGLRHEENITLLSASKFPVTTYHKLAPSTVLHSSPSTRLVSSMFFASPASLTPRPCPDPSRRLILSQAEIRLTDPCVGTSLVIRVDFASH